MKPIVLIIFILMFYSCNKTHIEYWENGNKKLEYSIRNGKKEGFEKRWYQSGRKHMQFEYKNGVLNGTSSRWYFNGNKEREDYYENNKLNGLSKIWNENGRLVIEKEYRNDTLHGIYREWFENGHKKIAGEHYKNLFHGKWAYYDPRGILVGEGTFNKGNGVLKGFTISGSINRIVNYQNNMKNGEEIWYYDNGEIEKIITYKDDRIQEIEDFNINNQNHE